MSLYRIRKDVPATAWMLPEANWYRNKVTFTSDVEAAVQLTQEQCDTYLALPTMHGGAYQEEIPA